MSLNMVGINMGIPTTSGLKTFDNTDVSQSILASSTVVIQTISGKGSAHLATAGDGDMQVNMAVSVDGGADVVFGTADTEIDVDYAFHVSLAIKATNTDSGGAHMSSSVSSTGVTQA